MAEFSTSDFLSVLRHKGKLKSYISEQSIADLEYILRKFTEVVDDLIKEKTDAQNVKSEILNEAKSILSNSTLSKTDLEDLFTELTKKSGLALARKDTTQRRRKSRLPVKYRHDEIKPNGKQVTYSWTGTGRRPVFFMDMSDEELEQYRVKDEE
ncbi:TPA: H-NS histone family protein [Enterobacter cloacae]|uniref:H-NS family histone-like protein n=1 Tax=Serratia ureilytica TaxID=300181 RepID=UPI00191ECDD1|nr:H-NS histone family protein [Serratia ureilytica]HEB0918923.1 H-NS histone family protein [Enterobacter cloacae]MBL0881562.1 H-NS histone family protein [Serratia ureilytica]MDN2473825.1 H-NS histone family protein [Serratia ureilytica]HEB0923960.1 H-NS histone family protein [Enterobacter cloacae]HEB0928860.1 H-NS histone family protein [Enterobacter cloacae]